MRAQWVWQYRDGDTWKSFDGSRSRSIQNRFLCRPYDSKLYVDHGELVSIVDAKACRVMCYVVLIDVLSAPPRRVAHKAMPVRCLRSPPSDTCVLPVSLRAIRHWMRMRARVLSIGVWMRVYDEVRFRPGHTGAREAADAFMNMVQLSQTS